jgi:hypothetical protein
VNAEFAKSSGPPSLSAALAARLRHNANVIAATPRSTVRCSSVRSPASTPLEPGSDLSAALRRYGSARVLILKRTLFLTICSHISGNENSEKTARKLK